MEEYLCTYVDKSFYVVSRLYKSTAEKQTTFDVSKAPHARDCFARENMNVPIERSFKQNGILSV